MIRNSYRGHYRRMVPQLLAALDFRSNNDHHRPVMEALDLVKRFAESKVRTMPIRLTPKSPPGRAHGARPSGCCHTPPYRSA